MRVLKKIENIVREEQDAAGVNEILMPTIQPADIWKESGRYDDYGKEMLRIKDRQGREMLFGPTNEEQVTDIFRRTVRSYKELPSLLYHIQWKFRDELRPRFGIMRGREFLMKDAYSFDLDKESSRASYNKFFVSYLKTFERLGLKAIPMAADTGPIGGDMSHEFVIISDTGESDIYFDNRILNLTNIDENIQYNSDLSTIVESYQDLYSVADDKFSEDDFNLKVPEEFRKHTKGIEVGHIFNFATKYSEPMKANVLNSNGKTVPVHMGSYGIGISRLVGAIIESSHDENGIIWPNSVTPFDIGLINLKIKDFDAVKICEKIYLELKDTGIDILYDNKDDSPGAKFSRMDLIGLPIQIICGKNIVKDGTVEIKYRNSGDVKLINISDVVNFIKNK